MERDNEDLFVFKSTGRKFSTHGMDCISITVDEQIRYGYDGYVELMDDKGHDDSELQFSLEEKQELAVYMIDKWSKFGGMSNGSYDRALRCAFQMLGFIMAECCLPRRTVAQNPM